jgi:hypothetical protein
MHPGKSSKLAYMALPVPVFEVWVNDGDEGGVARALELSAGSKLRLYLDLLGL